MRKKVMSWRNQWTWLHIFRLLLFYSHLANDDFRFCLNQSEKTLFFANFESQGLDKEKWVKNCKLKNVGAEMNRKREKEEPDVAYIESYITTAL